MVGQGYVGLPVAMRAVEVGFDVVGFDVSVERVEALARGESFVGDVSDATVAAALEAGYLPTFDAADLAGFDVAVISVPTPLRDGAPDLAYIEDAGRALGAHLRKGACVVLESTTYPGTTAELLGPILEEASGLVRGEYALGYSPERIDPGNETHTFVNTPKVTSGVDDASLAVVDAFFAALVDTTVAVGSPAEAELVKLLENTFRHVNIALVNEMAIFSKELGVDLWEAIGAASTKPFGFQAFYPGPGVGGHCIPIDPNYLSHSVRGLGYQFRFVELAQEISNRMPAYVVRRVQDALNVAGLPVNGSRVLLLGLTYKANIADDRETPARAVVRHLRELGADLVAHDPHLESFDVDGEALELVPDAIGAARDAQIVVLLQAHSVYDLEAIVAASRVIFDTRGKLTGDNVVRM